MHAYTAEGRGARNRAARVTYRAETVPIPTIVGPMPVIVKAKRSKSTEPEFSDEERQRGQEMLDKLMADPRRAARGE